MSRATAPGLKVYSEKNTDDLNNHTKAAKPLNEFLKRTLKLTMNTDAREGATRYGTTIDAVLTDYNRGFLYPTLVNTRLLRLS
ncbi:hypothetical protein TNCV_3804571 [Trichonephila clavipes]|nr:hypothetical protein TNCV_3804571 [Trichonephila clavipes]